MKQGKSRSESGFRCHWIQGCVIKKVTLWPVAQLDPPTSPVRSYSQEAAPTDWRTQLLAAPSSVSRRRHFFSSRFSKSLDRVICPSLSQPCSQGCGHSWMARCGVRALDIKMATSGWNFVGSEVGFLREKPRHDGWKKGFWTSKYQKCPPWFQPKPPYLVKQGSKMCLTAFDILTGFFVGTGEDTHSFLYGVARI